MYLHNLSVNCEAIADFKTKVGGASFQYIELSIIPHAHFNQITNPNQGESTSRRSGCHELMMSSCFIIMNEVYVEYRSKYSD